MLGNRRTAQTEPCSDRETPQLGSSPGLTHLVALVLEPGDNLALRHGRAAI